MCQIQICWINFAEAQYIPQRFSDRQTNGAFFIFDLRRFTEMADEKAIVRETLEKADSVKKLLKIDPLNVNTQTTI